MTTQIHFSTNFTLSGFLNSMLELEEAGKTLLNFWSPFQAIKSLIFQQIFFINYCFSPNTLGVELARYRNACKNCSKKTLRLFQSLDEANIFLLQPITFIAKKILSLVLLIKIIMHHLLQSLLSLGIHGSRGRAPIFTAPACDRCFEIHLSE